MRESKAIIEDGIIAGNLYDKYGTGNPIARYLVGHFQDTLDALVLVTGASNIHEVGCGEGNLCVRWAKQKKIVRASDVSKKIIDVAKNNAKENRVHIDFKVASVYDLTQENDAAELIVCCEVLEHLSESEQALKILAQLAKPYLIVSVPREPLWRVLNLARGKYIKDLGNTPGHIQHWSRRNFVSLLTSYVEIIRVATPIPWTMVLCRSKGQIT